MVAVVLYQSRPALIALLVVGFFFLTVSMVAAMAGPPVRHEGG